jgi:hypothetical protein
MIRKSISLLVLALAAAAVAAPIAQSSSAPKVDPLAVGYLIGQGLSPSQVTSWTTGACSHQAKAPSCYAMIDAARLAAASPVSKPVDPLAVGYLTGQGLSPSQVTSWTTGACSHQAKAPSCYAMFKPDATGSTQVTHSTSFQWGDAGIGAGLTLGIVLLIAGAGAGFLSSRQSRRSGAAHA